MRRPPTEDSGRNMAVPPRWFFQTDAGEEETYPDASEAPTVYPAMRVRVPSVSSYEVGYRTLTAVGFEDAEYKLIWGGPGYLFEGDLVEAELRNGRWYVTRVLRGGDPFIIGTLDEELENDAVGPLIVHRGSGGAPGGSGVEVNVHSWFGGTLASGTRVGAAWVRGSGYVITTAGCSEE